MRKCFFRRNQLLSGFLNKRDNTVATPLPIQQFSRHIFALLLCCLSGFSSTRANNISVSNALLTAQNTSTNIVRIQFSVSWENSFRIAAAPANWDAAWVFVKYRVAIASGGDGLWRHAKLNATGHIAPSGSLIKSVPEGAFIYRAAAGAGTFTVNNAGLSWTYGTHVESGTDDFIDDDDAIEIKIFAVEMVYIPAGAFYVGDGNTTNAFTPTRITNANASLTGSGFPTGFTNSNAQFPNGFSAFYCMKYEISQQQYVDFLNTLTVTQQALCTSLPPDYPAGQAAMTSNFRIPPPVTPNDNVNRNGIDIMIPSKGDTAAVYACNLDGDNAFNEENDGQWLACNFLLYSDWLAYMDWAGLRPMTELEYEKACRGTLPAVKNELAWGTLAYLSVNDIDQSGTAEETAKNSGSNANFLNPTFIDGPVRAGTFATNVSSRALAGASYYGIMELSGNVSEPVVHVVSNPLYTGLHGDGSITPAGNPDVPNWPGEPTTSPSRGINYRGGSWYEAPVSVSFRTVPININSNVRGATQGGRAVRTAPL